jgi:hypothetical protein
MVRAALRFGDDVVDLVGRGYASGALALVALAGVQVTREDDEAQFVPRGAVPARVARFLGV